MLYKFKNLVTPLSSGVKRVVNKRFYTPDTDSKSLQIFSLKQRLEKVTESLSVYDTKIVVARRETDLEREKDEEQHLVSIEYLPVHSNYLGKLYDEQKLIESYKKLLNERNEIFIEMKNLNAVDKYLHVTKDFTKHVYE